MESKLSYVAAILVMLATGSLAATSLVIPPIRATGDEVAAIFVPGAEIKGEAYLKTAQAIQNASSLRLWVALTGNYSLNTVNPLELPGAIESAILQLKNAGMKGKTYVGVAHSLGGVFLAPYARNSELKSLVLMGSYLTKGNDLKDYPMPILTLSSELDGQARITRIAVEYEQLQQDLASNPKAIFKTPVINIKGANHAQFASGPMPSAVVKYDLAPEVTEEEAHAMIGSHVSNFLTVTFSSSASNVSASEEALASAYNDSGNRFEPLLKIKTLDANGTSSPWAITSQKQIAGDLRSRVQVVNTIKSSSAFGFSKPEMDQSGDDVIIKTTSRIEYPSNPLDISTTPESPQELDIKMKSYDAIRSALRAQVSESNTTDCKALNKMALAIALQNSTPEAQARYKSKGRPIIFEDDIVYGTGIQWTSRSLKIDEEDDGLYVQSDALKVSIQSPIFAGDYYCKVLSPYRAMEWINVDSLRAKKPNRSFLQKLKSKLRLK